MSATTMHNREELMASEIDIARGLRGTSAAVKKEFHYLLADSRVVGSLLPEQEVFFTGRVKSPSFRNGAMHAEMYCLEVVFLIFKINLVSEAIIKRERRCFVDIDCLDCRTNGFVLLKKIAEESKRAR